MEHLIVIVDLKNAEIDLLDEDPTDLSCFSGRSYQPIPCECEASQAAESKFKSYEDDSRNAMIS